MITPSGPKVLEYNVRFGDPETQSMMLLLSQNTDLASVLLACTRGCLDQTEIEIRPGYACSVVISASGYPESYSTGHPISISPIDSANIHIFHAGTKIVNGILRSAGGRVLCVAAYGDSLGQAVKLAYEGVERIKFPGMYFRNDIANRYVMF